MAGRAGRPQAAALEQAGAPVQYMAGIARDVRKIDELGGSGAADEGKFLGALGRVLAAQRRGGIVTQKLTDYGVEHAALGQPQTHAVKKGGELGDEVVDFPIANRLHDDGDMHVSADQIESYTFKQRKPHTSQLRAVIAGPPAVADPADDNMYATKLEKLGVNVGSKPSQGGFSTHGDVFVKADGLEESYGVGPSPQREHNGNTIGGDFFGHVGDMPWTKEQIQAQARREHTQALAVLPGGKGPASKGWCQCAAGRACECFGGSSRKAKTMSLNMACCKCGGALSSAKHPSYVAPAHACSLCETDCSKLVLHPPLVTSPAALHPSAPAMDVLSLGGAVAPWWAVRPRARVSLLATSPRSRRIPPSPLPIPPRGHLAQAYSPLYNPYGQRDAAEKAHVLHKGVRGQQLHALSAKSAREPFYKLHERPGYPTRGMLALNTIIQVCPPPPCVFILQGGRKCSLCLRACVCACFCQPYTCEHVC